ncbi:MAG: hypothetical protein INQ03_00680 [Candidatus Heimdallarchaeota archaeon]|nr:hypothetical protein [Candidatus Heimdallarchaeota archaeon]
MIIKRINVGIGLLIGLVPFLIDFLLTRDFMNYFFDQAFSTLNLVKILRTYSWLGWMTLITCLSLIILSVKISSFDNRWINGVSGVLMGYFIIRSLFYLAIDSIFYRQAFISYPFMLGMGLILSLFLLLRSDQEILSVYRTKKSEETWGINVKIVTKAIFSIMVFLLAILLILPGFAGMLGFSADPPSIPDGYGGLDRPYYVTRTRLEQTVNTTLQEYIINDYDNGSWYSYIYVPDTTKILPVAIYLHGYSGADINYYHKSMMTLASRGVISIFVQYASNIDMELTNSYTDKSNPIQAIRYQMEWEGILQVIEYLDGADLAFDLNHLVILGHSMGGGMVPYIATEAIKMGWGKDSLVLDMEAPYYTTEWEDIKVNYTLPDHALVNIVGYEDDHLVSPCIGMETFEQIKDNSNLANDQISYLLIRSDRYGYPRLVASHYLPTDPLYDSLAIYGYFKRIDAMADYLTIRMNGGDTEMITTYFLGNMASDMGSWSDGTEVIPALSTKDPYNSEIINYVNSEHDSCHT